jgi:hypothetical protein
MWKGLTEQKIEDIEMMLNAFEIYWKETEIIQPGIGGCVIKDARWMLKQIRAATAEIKKFAAKKQTEGAH